MDPRGWTVATGCQVDSCGLYFLSKARGSEDDAEKETKPFGGLQGQDGPGDSGRLPHPRVTRRHGDVRPARAFHHLLDSRGAHQGQKAFTLQTLAPCGEDVDDDRLAKAGGFSLHCGVAAAAHQRDKRERLCRCIARPAIANERMELTRQGDVRYRLKTPYRDGTTHVVFTPLDFMARLARWCSNHGST